MFTTKSKATADWNQRVCNIEAYLKTNRKGEKHRSRPTIIFITVLDLVLASKGFEITVNQTPNTNANACG